MNYTDQLARRTVILLMLLTLANLWASYKTAENVHAMRDMMEKQVAATAATAQQAKAASSTINEAAQSLCASSHVECKATSEPPRKPQ